MDVPRHVRGGITLRHRFMITFEDHGADLLLDYYPDSSPPNWVDEKLDRDGSVLISHVFRVSRDDLIEPGDLSSEDSRLFKIGNFNDGYRVIRKDVLGLQYDLLISVDIPISRPIFVAERNISIFRRIDRLITEQIIVGGDREGAIPAEDFFVLLQRFPTSTELTHYADARVSRILQEYLRTMTNSERRLSSYVAHRDQSLTKTPGAPAARIPEATILEREKFIYVRERLKEMLSNTESYVEAEWQKMVADLFLLIFPQYVCVLQNVQVKDDYSNHPRSTYRYIDLVLVGANGQVDIIEIKRPIERGLVTRRQYRDNHVPVRDLAGALMQVEKYLFHLNKSGKSGEISIGSRHATELPTGLNIRISNPKAIVLAGRENNLTAEEKFDLEFIRRKYSNVMDIISYDDLLRRLGNVISALDERLDVVSKSRVGLGRPPERPQSTN